MANDKALKQPEHLRRKTVGKSKKAKTSSLGLNRKCLSDRARQVGKGQIEERTQKKKGGSWRENTGSPLAVVRRETATQSGCKNREGKEKRLLGRPFLKEKSQERGRGKLS